jgi:hypothetical protein
MKGDHEQDRELTLDSALAQVIGAVQQHLRQLASREVADQMVPGVFVSYSHADRSFVDQLTRRFEFDQIDFWRDEKDLLVGDVIDRTISAGIQSHALFLLVLSPASIASKWVNRELDEAAHEVAEGRKLLLALLTGGLTVDEAPPRVRRFRCADFNTDFPRAHLELKTAITVHLQRMGWIVK